MLSSICASRRSILACVKLRSRVLTALNLLPSIATLAGTEQLETPAQYHELTAHLANGIAVVLRKSAIVLKAGVRRPVNQTNSMLRWHSRSRRRLDCTRLRYPST